MHMFQTLYHELVLTNRTFEAQLNAILQQQGIHRSDWSVLYYLILDDRVEQFGDRAIRLGALGDFREALILDPGHLRF